MYPKYKYASDILARAGGVLSLQLCNFAHTYGSMPCLVISQGYSVTFQKF